MADLTTSSPATLSSALQAKLTRLRALLGEIGHAAVAYSGSTASTVLAVVAYELLGDHMLAVFTVSDSMSSTMQDDSLMLLEDLEIPYVMVRSGEVNDPRYAANPANRCYFCKLHVIDAAVRTAEEYGFMTVIDSDCAPTLDDQRAGLQAVEERGVRSPLIEAEFTRADIAALARYLGLPPDSDRRAQCLANRVVRDQRITPRILTRIDQAELALRGLGFEALRVYHHDQLARISVPVADASDVLARRQRITKDLQAIGYRLVALDLQGLDDDNPATR